jgi:drug/metabolite transporter (DMT)-like permease
VTSGTYDRASSGPRVAVTGWLEAFGYVLAIGVLNIVYAVANQHGAHAVVFILYSLLVSAAAMLAVAGPGGDAVRIMLAPMSWVVGLSNIGMESAYCLMLITVAPAPGSLIARLSIPIAVVLGVLLLGRRPGSGTWIGALVIVAGVGLVLATLDLPGQTSGLAYGLAAALLISVRAFATEFHPWNRAARTIGAKLQVTGLVVLFTGLVGLALATIASRLVAAGVLERSVLAPEPADFVHLPTIGLALLVGGALFTAMNYFQFSSVVKIRTENFLAAGAFMPLVTLVLQISAEALGLLRAEPVDWRLMPATLLTIAGVLVLVRARPRAADAHRR